MNADQKSFIDELRALSEPVKRRILFCTAITSMVVVVSLWLAYFNTIVPGAVPVAAEAPTTGTAQNANPGILNLFTDAASSFWNVALGAARGTVDAVKNPKQYNIGPK